MASITSSAVFGKVSALKASKSVKRCVRCVRCVFRFFSRASTIRDRVTGRARDVGDEPECDRWMDALVSRPRDPWIAIAGRGIVGTRCERCDGVGRHARCVGRTKEFFDAHRAW